MDRVDDSAEETLCREERVREERGILSAHTDQWLVGRFHFAAVVDLCQLLSL